MIRKAGFSDCESVGQEIEIQLGIGSGGTRLPNFMHYTFCFDIRGFDRRSSIWISGSWYPWWISLSCLPCRVVGLSTDEEGPDKKDHRREQRYFVDWRTSELVHHGVGTTDPILVGNVLILTALLLFPHLFVQQIQYIECQALSPAVYGEI